MGSIEQTKTYKRYSAIALLLSYLFPGTGFIYVGKFSTAIKFLALFFISIFLLVLLTVTLKQIGLYIGLSLFFVLFLYNLIIPTVTAYKITVFHPTLYNKYYVYLLYIALQSILFLVMTTLFIQPFNIPATSMQNTLMKGDLLFAKKYTYGIAAPYYPIIDTPIFSNKHLYRGVQPKRGDVVIFRYPANPSLHYVKRCVALPGDKVAVRDKDLFIHPKEGDEYIKENYIGFEIMVYGGELWVKNPYQKAHPGIHHDDKIVNNGNYPQPIFNFGPVQVEKEHYFMMGDNRDHSNDSRFWGTVPYHFIQGSPWFIYFSIGDNFTIRFDRMGKTVEDLEIETTGKVKNGLY